MKIYTPDRWVVLRLSDGLESSHKLFAGWYGNFTDGASWKLNSGITSVTKKGDWIDFEGYTGSVYRCNIAAEGLSTYMQAILTGWRENHGLTIDTINYDNLPKQI